MRVYWGQAVEAYKNALEVRTRKDLPQHWANTQNNLGSALRDQGIRTGGSEGARLLGQAVKAYKNALDVRTSTDLPQDWAVTQNNLAKAYYCLEDWESSSVCYVNVLEIYPDYREAFNTACYLYHDKIFRFSEAFELSRKWLEKHPDDVDALADFTEQHLTSGRFAELETLVKPLLSNPDLESSSRIALRAI